MLPLTQITDNLEVRLSAAVTTNELAILSSWVDIIDGVEVPGRSPASSAGETAVVIVDSARPAGTTRTIDSISIYNKDTASATVIVQFDFNGTKLEIGQWTLRVGERLEYANGSWVVTTSSGAIKTEETAGVVADFNIVMLTGDVTNAEAVANTMLDVTGLSFEVVAGQKYWFEFLIAYTSAATTTGSRWSINGPSAPTLLAYRSEYVLTATTQTINFLSAYDSPAASNATSLTAGNTARIAGIITPSSSGTVIARFASEVTVSAIVAKAGSTLRWSTI